MSTRGRSTLNFQHPATIRPAISLCAASRRLEAFLNRDPRWALSQERPAPWEGATRERLERIGGSGALIIDWLDDAPLDAVPLGQLADRIVAFLRERRSETLTLTLTTWRERNRHALREFWARAPADALGVKQEFEKALDRKPTT